MSAEPTFPVEPWQLREPILDPEHLARTESLFALSNGHIGVRGNLDEGEPHDLPGTYLNSFFESHQLNFPESGYGYPESGQSVVNVPNGKIIRLLVDDEPFDVRSGRLLRHERTLDFRTGTLQREVDWLTPAGRRVRIRTTRLVSFSQRAILAIRYEVEPVGRDARIVLQSELLANEPVPEPPVNPGADEAMPHMLDREGLAIDGSRACLMYRTQRSGIQLAAAVDHVVQVGAEAETEMEEREDSARFTVRADLQAGQVLQLTKFVAYAWSAHRSAGALREQADGALTAAIETGWDGLAKAQRRYLAEFWARADVELDGDPAVQQAVRFGLFHLLQASAHAEQRPIAAKGLTGDGYAGHAFWDTEGFVLPVLTATLPQAAADALRWRRSTLPVALDWARTLRLRGAAFAWRTINGEECGGYWPAGTAAFHVNADIARARSSANWIWKYIGCSEISVPSLSKVAMRSGTGTKSGPSGVVTLATKARIAALVGPSFQEGSGSAWARAWAAVRRRAARVAAMRVNAGSWTRGRRGGRLPRRGWRGGRRGGPGRRRSRRRGRRRAGGRAPAPSRGRAASRARRPASVRARRPRRSAACGSTPAL